jgi:hypothetical protein
MGVFDEELKAAWAKLDDAKKSELSDVILNRAEISCQNGRTGGEGRTQAREEAANLAKGNYVPHVIEPSAGVDRLALALICNAYCEDQAPDEKGKLEKSASSCVFIRASRRSRWRFFRCLLNSLAGPNRLEYHGADLAEHPAAVLLAENFHHQIQVPAHHPHALLKIRLRRQFARAQKMPGVPENPRIVKRAAPDAHARAACFLEHHFGRLRRGDVAIADDGNARTACTTARMPARLTVPPKTLLARAAMHKNRRRARVFQRARQVRRRQVFVVPAQPHFGGDRNFHRVHHAAHQRGGFVQLGHHGRAAADAADLAHRAAHVDVHRRHADGFQIGRRVAHFLRHGAEQLHRQRPVRGAGFDQLERLGIFSRSERALTRSVVARSSPPISRNVSRKAGWCNPPAAKETNSTSIGARTLELDYRISEDGNSGIMYHVTNKGGAIWATGPEFQLEDNATAEDPQRCGWLYALYSPPIDPATGKPIDATKPANQWNHVRILITPQKCEHYINGVKYFEYVLHSDDFNAKVAASKFGSMPNFAKSDVGFIGLQGDHPGAVSFRNVKIRPIKQ